jgi:hypothetical protein
MRKDQLIPSEVLASALGKDEVPAEIPRVTVGSTVYHRAGAALDWLTKNTPPPVGSGVHSRAQLAETLDAKIRIATAPPGIY